LPHQRQRLLNREDRALHIGVEGFVDVLGSDLAKRNRASSPGIGEDVPSGPLISFRSSPALSWQIGRAIQEDPNI